MIDRQRERVLGQIEQLKENLQILDYKHWYYETAKSAGTCAVHATLTKEDIPQELRSARECLEGREAPRAVNQ